jgi:hypothetical protein
VKTRVQVYQFLSETPEESAFEDSNLILQIFFFFLKKKMSNNQEEEFQQPEVPNIQMQAKLGETRGCTG